MFYYTYFVICIEGKFKGKIYFGKHSTTNLDDGYICSSTLIRKWVKKHLNGYVRQIIAFYNSEKELNEAEYNLIHPHLGKEYCLNLTEGGLGTHLKGEKHPFFGKHHTNETKQRISEKNKGRKNPKSSHPMLEKTRKKISIANKGKKRSEETKQKISQSNKGKIRTEEYKRNISIKNTGRKCTNIQKENISLKTKEAMKQPEVKKKLGSGVRGKHKVWDNKKLNIFHYE